MAILSSRLSRGKNVMGLKCNFLTRIGVICDFWYQNNGAEADHPNGDCSGFVSPSPPSHFILLVLSLQSLGSANSER